jgi:triacylglycerol lipase
MTPRVRTDRAILALALRSAAAVCFVTFVFRDAEAQRTPAPQPPVRPATRPAAPSHLKLDIARGESLIFRASGKDYAALDSVRVVHLLNGRLVPARDVTARISRSRGGGRWVELRASRSAPGVVHRIEGLQGRSVKVVFPIALDVKIARRGSPILATARSTEVSTAVFGPDKIAATVASRLAVAAPKRFFVEEVYRHDKYRVPLSDLVPIPGLENDGPGGPYKPGSGTIGVAVPNTQVHALVPESLGIVGSTLEIHGSELPHTQCEVRLGSTVLVLESKSSTKIVARLPSSPITADLIFVRTSDNAQAVLADDYVVQAATAPKAFDGFDAAATTRTWKHAYLLSLLSWIAYTSESSVEGHASTWGLTLSKPMIDETTWFFADPGTVAATGSTQACVLHNSNAVIVAFRGSTTENWAQDWIDNDLDFFPIPKPTWGLTTILHHGFHEAMSVAYGDVLARIQPLMSGRKLWITGHSLGGAVALLTAFRLEHETTINVQGVHVFGAPSVGNGTWAGIFADKVSNVHRWNLEQDPVPFLLPAPAFFHVGTVNNLYADGDETLDDPLLLGYTPGPSTPNDLLVVHMNYWNRLLEELEENDPEAATGLPEPPSGN